MEINDFSEEEYVYLVSSKIYRHSKGEIPPEPGFVIMYSTEEQGNDKSKEKRGESIELQRL